MQELSSPTAARRLGAGHDRPGDNGSAAYVAAKCAVDGYVQTVNREVSRHNVVLSAVAPGAIYSEGRHFAKLQITMRIEVHYYSGE